MAKGKSKSKQRSSKSRAKAKVAHHTVAKPKFASNTYDCYGKHVSKGKGKGKRPAVYCGKVA